MVELIRRGRVDQVARSVQRGKSHLDHSLIATRCSNCTKGGQCQAIKKKLTPTSNLKIITIPHPAETPNPWVRQGTGMWRTSLSVLHLPPASDVQMTTSGRRVFSAIVFRIPLWSAVYVPPLYPFLGTKKTRTKKAQLQRMAVFCNGRRDALWEFKRKYFGKRNSMIRLQRHACQPAPGVPANVQWTRIFSCWS